MTALCDACKATGVQVERDRRVPAVFGGTYAPANTHYLCVPCHRRKNELERILRTSAGVRYDEAHAEWLPLAFPLPVPDDTAIYVDAWFEGLDLPDEKPEPPPGLIEELRLLLRRRDELLDVIRRSEMDAHAEAVRAGMQAAGYKEIRPGVWADLREGTDSDATALA